MSKGGRGCHPAGYFFKGKVGNNSVRKYGFGANWGLFTLRDMINIWGGGWHNEKRGGFEK